MQLAREPSALELLRLDHPADGVATDPLGKVDGDRSTGGERLREPQVVLAEHGRRSLLVVRDHDADRPSAHDQRHVQRRVDAEPTGRLLVDLRIVEQRVDPLAAAALEHASRLRAAECELHPRDAVGALALGRRHPQHVALRERDQDELRVDELLQPARDEARSGSSSSSETSALPISFSDSNWRSQRVELS